MSQGAVTFEDAGLPRPKLVGDVMTREVVTIGPQASYTEIVHAMLKHDVSGLPVLSADGELLGMVTDADLIAKDGRGRARVFADRMRGRGTSSVARTEGRVAADLMSTDVDTASPDDDLHAVARLMLQRRHKRLPVLDEGRVVGIVARHDLLRPFGRTDTELVVDVEIVLSLPGMPPDLDASFQVDHGVVRVWGSARVPSDITPVINAIARIPGVVAVDSQLLPRDPNPTGRL